MPTTPKFGECGYFGSGGGEGGGISLVSVRGVWNCTGLASGSIDVVVDAADALTLPSFGSTHVPHYVTGGSSSRATTFDRLFVMNGSGPVNVGNGKLSLKLGDRRLHWGRQGTYTLTANQPIYGVVPAPAKQSRGSHNPEINYPAQFWRSVETILRELMMRLNVAPGELVLTGSRYADLSRITVASRSDGSSTPILNDCPPVEYNDVPVAVALQDMCDKYFMDVVLSPSGNVGFRMRDQPASVGGRIEAEVMALGEEVVEFKNDRNADLDPDSIAVFGEPIVMEDVLAMEPVMPDPWQPGRWVAMVQRDSLGMYSIGQGDRLKLMQAIGAPGLSTEHATIAVWHMLATQNPPFAMIPDERLRGMAAQAFRYWRVMQPRARTTVSKRTRIVTVVDPVNDPGGITSYGEWPDVYDPYIISDGTFDPGAGGQSEFTPESSSAYANPWRVLPLLPYRHSVNDDGTFAMVPHGLLVKNAVIARAQVSQTMGNESLTWRDLGPLVPNPKPSEMHDDAAEWPYVPTIIDAADGVVDAGAPIFGNTGKSKGGVSELVDQLSWATAQGVTPDIWEEVWAWGRPIVFWQGCHQYRPRNDPMHEITNIRTVANGQLFLKAPVYATSVKLPKVGITSRNPEKGYATMRRERSPGVQLHLIAARSTPSFQAFDFYSDDPQGTFTFQDVTPGNPGGTGDGQFLPVSPEHQLDVASVLSAHVQAVAEQLGKARASDEYVQGYSATIEGWYRAIFPGIANGIPVERVSIQGAGKGTPVTCSFSHNSRGPRLEFGDAEAARSLYRAAMPLSGDAILGSQNVQTGGGGSGGGGGSAIASPRADPTPAEPGMGARTITVADQRSPGTKLTTGGSTAANLGEIGIVDLPNGRRIPKGKRHAAWAKGYVPGDWSEAFLDSVELLDGSSALIQAEGLTPLATSARDDWNKDTAWTTATLKPGVKMPVRNIYLLDHEEVAGEETPDAEHHADLAVKCYLFFDHSDLAAGDRPGAGGVLRQRAQDVNTFEAAADNDRHSISLGDLKALKEEGKELPQDPGANWSFICLLDAEDWSQDADANRYYRLGTAGKRNNSGAEFFTEPNVRKWNKITVPSVSAGSCGDYCDLPSLVTGYPAGFTEDLNQYSRQSSVAVLADHVETLYGYIDGGARAAMAWAYAHKAMTQLTKLMCCLCQAVDFDEFQSCVCDGEVESLMAETCGALCETDCDGAATSKPDCCQGSGFSGGMSPGYGGP